MAVSWLVFPWYTSNEHLELLGTAYSNAGKLIEQLYNAFHTACQAESEVSLSQVEGLDTWLECEMSGIHETYQDHSCSQIWRIAMNLI